MTIYCQNVKVASGVVKRFENMPSKYIDARNVDVWLPQGYTPKKKYAVLYMHDGQMLFDSTINFAKKEWRVDETLSWLIAHRKMRECIVVGIWNNGKKRHAEYFPKKAFDRMPPSVQDSFLNIASKKIDGLFVGKVQSDNYLKFLVEELKPLIDTQFSTLKDRDNTLLAGSSMGGLISMYAMCEYPSVFGGAACLSTHWVGTLSVDNNPIPDALLAYFEQHLPEKSTHKLYFDNGTEGLDALYPPFQKKADDILKAHGFDKKNWLSKEFIGADHSEKAWAKRLSIPILFLMKR